MEVLGGQAQVQTLKSEKAQLVEAKAAAAADAHRRMHALQEELARAQHRCQEAQTQHSEALAALRADAKSKAAALQQQLAEVSGERDFFMAQGSESSSLVTQAAQERDSAQARLVEVEESIHAMHEVSDFHALTTRASCGSVSVSCLP